MSRRHLSSAQTGDFDAPAAGLRLRRSACAPAERECKRVLFVRHAEGLHNQDERDWPEWWDSGGCTHPMYRDARLTARGESQCAVLRDQLAATQQGVVDLVVVSSLSRAIQTAELSFGALGGARPPFVSTELCRERISKYTCDWRRPRSELQVDFPAVDFSLLEGEEDQLWHRKEHWPSESDAEATTARAGAFLRWLAGRPERRIAVVSHWVFLQHLLRAYDSVEVEAMGNAETRERVLCAA